MGSGNDADAAVGNLLDALGIDPQSYQRFVAWALAEQLVVALTDAVGTDPDHQARPLWDRPDGGKRFRQLLRGLTGRNWSADDEGRLFDRVRLAMTDHERKPIAAEDLLRLLWNLPHICTRCGRKPPEVKLHIDHIFPASRGGTSKFDNLQFLCAKCNLSKSNKLEQEDLWLDSV